ncbi:MAG: DUF3598 family protein [Dehalococcoidia bacterium]
MTTYFEALCLNEGAWDGIWSYFRPPTPELPVPTPSNERRSTLIFERLGPSQMRQTNRYAGMADLVWEYQDTPERLEWFQVSADERKPGDPNFIAAIRTFAGGMCFTSGYLRLMESLPFVCEQGIVEGDRKRRGMVMYDPAGSPTTLIAIRETRGQLTDDDHVSATLDDLLGEWQGDAQILRADGTPEERTPSRLQFDHDDGVIRMMTSFGDLGISLTGTRDGESVMLSNGHRLGFLPGRLVLSYPQDIPAGSDRAFTVSLWWLPEPGRLRRMVRQYDASGAWLRSVLTNERRI